MTTKAMTHKTQEAALEKAQGVRYWLHPAVDILENEHGLVIVADVPGITSEGLDIGVEDGILSIQGRTREDTAGLVFRDAGHTGYRRRFQLPDNLDLDKISAELKDGVLTLRLPKSEAAKPRRIEVTVH